MFFPSFLLCYRITPIYFFYRNDKIVFCNRNSCKSSSSVITWLLVNLHGPIYFFPRLENLLSVMEVKTDSGKGKAENLISSSPWKSSCESIIHQTVKLTGAVKFRILASNGCLPLCILFKIKVLAISSEFCSFNLEKKVFLWCCIILFCF